MNYKNPELSVKERVEDLLARMTLEEKVAQCVQIYIPPENRETIVERIRATGLGSRILSAEPLGGSVSQRTAGIADLNEIQRVAVEESRLGIPILNGMDVIHGMHTVFPIPLAMAATFDPAALEEACAIAAAETECMGIHWTFAPMMDIARDPRWGRIIEGFGEDPYLASKMAAAAVHGFQGELDERGYFKHGRILACAKHYVGYGAAEGGRDYNTGEISDHTLRNIYLPPFKAAVEAGVGTVMSAFHDLNGEPASGSHYLLTDILKDEFDFKGFVISDWSSVGELINHRVVSAERDAARLAFEAGVEMEMISECYTHHLGELVQAGEISQERLDDAVRRVLEVKFRLGLFDRPYADTSRQLEQLPLEQYQAAARRMAARSMVLLKNNGLLPLKPDAGRIAVIGPYANERRTMLGSWVNDILADQPQTLADAMKAACPGARILTADSGLYDEMLMAAADADVVVLALGESHARNGEYNSVASIELPAGQQELLDEVAGLGKPLAVVVFAGRPVALTRMVPQVDSLLLAWHPGSMGAEATTDVLLGKANPGGRLPVSLPRAEGQIPVHYNHNSTGRFNPRYLDLPVTPLFPFGFGLSYSSFAVDGLDVQPHEIHPDQKVRVSVSVTNNNGSEGEQVVQCYVQDCVSRLTRPVRELKGFERVNLKPGESRRVTFELGAAELSYYGPGGQWVLEPGEFKVWVGGDSTANLEGSFLVV